MERSKKWSKKPEYKAAIKATFALRLTLRGQFTHREDKSQIRVIVCKLLGFEVYDKKVKNLAYGGYSSADHFGWLKRWLKPIVLARGQ